MTRFMTSAAVAVKQSPLPMLLSASYDASKDVFMKMEEKYDLQANAMYYLQFVGSWIVQSMWKLETEFRLSQKMSQMAKGSATLVGKTVVAYKNADEVRDRRVSL